MISADHLRKIAASYLSDNDADKFVLEFSAVSHNIQQNGDAEALELANEIDRKMADLQSGHISVSSFRDSLRAATELPISNSYEPPLVRTASSTNPSVNVLQQWGIPAVVSLIRFGDRRPALV